MTAEITARISVFRTGTPTSVELVKSSTYHLKDRPLNTDVEDPALKEKTTITSRGR